MANGASMPLNNYRSYRRYLDKRGLLGVIEDYEVPFEIKRVFWIRDVPAGTGRGHHSHKECLQFIICVAGSFDVWLNDDCYQMSVRNDQALYIPADVNVILNRFSPDAVCLVLASENYNYQDLVEDGLY